MSADKLLETINQALQRAGGEATRVWPDMVTAWRFSATINLAFCLVVFLAGVYFGRRCLRFARAADTDDEIAGWVGLLACVVAAGLALLFGSDMVPRVVYPEATLLFSLLQK